MDVRVVFYAELAQPRIGEPNDRITGIVQRVAFVADVADPALQVIGQEMAAVLVGTLGMAPAVA